MCMQERCIVAHTFLNPCLSGYILTCCHSHLVCLMVSMVFPCCSSTGVPISHRFHFNHSLWLSWNCWNQMPYRETLTGSWKWLVQQSICFPHWSPFCDAGDCFVVFEGHHKRHVMCSVSTARKIRPNLLLCIVMQGIVYWWKAVSEVTPHLQEL